MLPLIIFILGFLNSIVAILLISCSLYALCEYYHKEDICGIFPLSKKQLLTLAVCSIIFCWMAGIGGFFCQTGDYLVKNALLRDLCNHEWPLYIDLAGESMEVQKIIGSDKVAFVYYLFLYLPAALCGKIGGEIIARIVFLLWSSFGLFLVLANTTIFICKKKQICIKQLMGFLLLFFCFGGLDIIGYIRRLENPSLYTLFFQYPVTSFVEMWCFPYFRLWGGNIHDLAFVFNQCIPTWLMTILIIDRPNNKSIFFIFLFTLLYSPWATIGLFPIVIYIWIRDYDKNLKFMAYIKTTISFHNIVYPIIILFLIAMYYGANEAATETKGWFWDFMTVGEFLIFYPLFIIVEIGIYLFFLKKCILTNPILQISFITLFCLPFYHITPGNDLLMRASIPALYVIFVYWCDFVFSNYEKKKKLLISIIFLTSFSSTHQYTEAFSLLVQKKHIVIVDPIGSFYDIKESKHAEMCDFQFFSHDYEQKIFFKYLAK